MTESTINAQDHNSETEEVITDSSNAEEQTQGENTDTQHESEDSVEALKKEVEKWKALSRKNEGRAKEKIAELESLQDTVSAYEKSKSTLEELQAQNRELEAQNITLYTQKRLSEAGLSEDLTALVQGGTPDEVDKKISLLTSTTQPSTIPERSTAAPLVGVPFKPTEQPSGKNPTLSDYLRKHLNT